MIGLVANRKDREYRIPQFVALTLISDQQRFSLEGGGYIYSSQEIKEGIEYEFLISEFDEPSELLSDGNHIPEIDYEFEEALYSEESQRKQELQTFRRLEAILKNEGLI